MTKSRSRARIARVLASLAVTAAAVLVAHMTRHLDWFWTGSPADIIGGQGLALGDLHLFIHLARAGG